MPARNCQKLLSYILFSPFSCILPMLSLHADLQFCKLSLPLEIATPCCAPPHTFVQEWEAVRGGEGAMGLEETFSTLRRDICVMPILSTEYVPVFGRGEPVFVGLQCFGPFEPKLCCAFSDTVSDVQGDRAANSCHGCRRVRDHLRS